MSLEKFKKELQPYQNTLVINDLNEVVKLVSVYDGGDDYYWTFNDGEKDYDFSCVGGWIPLKGFIPEKSYERLIYTWNINNEHKVI